MIVIISCVDAHMGKNNKMKQRLEELLVRYCTPLLGGATEVREYIWGTDCQDCWRQVTAGRGWCRRIALVNKDAQHEGRLHRVRICDLDGKENRALAWSGPAVKAMARHRDLILLWWEAPGAHDWQELIVLNASAWLLCRGLTGVIIGGHSDIVNKCEVGLD